MPQMRAFDAYDTGDNKCYAVGIPVHMEITHVAMTGIVKLIFH